MWNFLPVESLIGMNTGRCNHGGYCTRTTQHRGCHTATPNAATPAWDNEHKTAQALALLDWPTPHFGTALDPID